LVELILLGIFVGTLSGFFGIGGGTILVPLLLFFGFEIKDAIGISVVQMVFSSIFGSFLNIKNGSLDIKMVLMIGVGGAFGALSSGLVTSMFSKTTLEFIFLFFAIFALIRLFFKTKENVIKQQISPILLFCLGVPIGALSMTIGVGGSIILVPILVGFLHIELKKAISAGLFFVIFSSLSGLISHLYYGSVDYISGITIGLASLVGVYGGVFLKEQVNSAFVKKLLVLFYLIIVLYLVQRLLF